MKVLLLGGTAEARQLASLLVCDGHDVVSSLAGRVSAPRLPDGDVRVGGFGGAAGLARFLATEHVDHVVDATHPFAAKITRNAVQACALSGVRLTRLSRPSWAERPDSREWVWVDSHAAAASAIGRDDHVLLTVGRLGLSHYVTLPNSRVLARVADPADVHVPANWQLISERGPFSVRDEQKLIADAAITTLVSKDSGGDSSSAKLDAARALGVQIVMIARPSVPPGLHCVSSVDAVVSTCAELSQPPQ